VFAVNDFTLIARWVGKRTAAGRYTSVWSSIDIRSNLSSSTLC